MIRIDCIVQGSLGKSLNVSCSSRSKLVGVHVAKQFHMACLSERINMRT